MTLAQRMGTGSYNPQPPLGVPPGDDGFGLFAWLFFAIGVVGLVLAVVS